MTQTNDIEWYTTYSQEIEQLVAYLKEHHPANVVMPLRMGNKSPVFAHKDGLWTWERAEEHLSGSMEKDQPVGILLRDMIAIDVDSRALLPVWEERFPELQRCPKEDTRGGAHYIMARTALCDELGLYDVAGGLKEDGDKLPVDIKTLCSTGTAGVLCVAPSPGKQWVRGLTTTPLPPISDDLVRQVAAMRTTVAVPQSAEAHGPRAKKVKVGSVTRPRGKGAAPQGMDAVEMHALLALLSMRRWDSYSDWVRIGIAIKAQDPDNEKGFREVYEALSERSEHWTPEADGKWEQLPRQGSVGLGTLHMWAKEDSPADYGAYRIRTMRHNLNMMCRLGPTSHYHAARCLQCLYPGEFVSTNETKRAFYAFYDHRWHVGGDSRISEVISTELADALRTRHYEKVDELAADMQSDDKQARKAAVAALAKSEKLWSSCYSNEWKGAVMRELQHVAFANEGNAFLRALDADSDLLGFDNGVLNVRTREFSAGRPEQMVSRTCGYEYTAVVDEDVRAQVHSFISSCLPSEETIKFCLQSLAACLAGVNRNEVFIMWLGSGRNGKGATAELIGQTLNDGDHGYAGTIDVSYFTTQTKSSACASPEVAALQGRRFVTCSEPEKGQQLQGGKVKKISGRDNITARHLYGEMLTWKPQFIVFMQANNLPKLNQSDEAVSSRLRVQRWPYKFKANPVHDNEKLIDMSFKETKAKSLAWRQQFMLLLLDHQVEHLESPQEVLEASTEYEQSCCPLAEWVEDRIDFHVDEGGNVDDFEVMKTDWYNDYRDHSNSLGHSYLGSKQAAQALKAAYWDSKRLGSRHSNGTMYMGMRLKIDMD